jgi:hypothetical protein
MRRLAIISGNRKRTGPGFQPESCAGRAARTCVDAIREDGARPLSPGESGLPVRGFPEAVLNSIRVPTRSVPVGSDTPKGQSPGHRPSCGSSRPRHVFFDLVANPVANQQCAHGGVEQGGVRIQRRLGAKTCPWPKRKEGKNYNRERWDRKAVPHFQFSLLQFECVFFQTRSSLRSYLPITRPG